MNRKTMVSRLILLLIVVSTATCNRSTKLNHTDSHEVTILEPEKEHSARSVLEAFVKAPDDAFEYKVVNKTKGKGFSRYVIRMVSQNWLTKDELKDPVWWHQLTLIVPDSCTANTALIFINSGSRESKPILHPDKDRLKLALGSKSIVANLNNIPNHPIQFINDPFGPRIEDEMIAYGWRQFLERGANEEDAKWLPHFPMTKAVVKAMDVITAFTEDNPLTPTTEKFVLTGGGSKRGWVTWTTAMADDRVVAIAPIVFDLLHITPTFEHQWKIYGKWTPAVGNYLEEGIMKWQNSEEFWRLTQLIEPYSFKDKILIPKLLLNASGDQFFPPDSWQFYWNELKGEKLLRYVPNAEHSMLGTDAAESLLAFYHMIVEDQKRPQFDWEVIKGTIYIQTQPQSVPESVTLWQAHNPKTRSFEIDSIGRKFQPSELPIAEDGKYAIKVDAPDQGWTSFFVELKFPGIGKVPLKLSTGVVVTPDKYPYESYINETPLGTPRQQ